VKYTEPEKLHEKTPQWFKEWYNKAFWHFKHEVENKLNTHDKLLWGIVIAVMAGAVLNIIFR